MATVNSFLSSGKRWRTHNPIITGMFNPEWSFFAGGADSVNLRPMLRHSTGSQELDVVRKIAQTQIEGHLDDIATPEIQRHRAIAKTGMTIQHGLRIGRAIHQRRIKHQDVMRRLEIQN